VTSCAVGNGNQPFVRDNGASVAVGEREGNGVSGTEPAFEPPYVLAIDMGTSSTRAIVFDRRGRQVQATETQNPYDMITTPDGGVELDPAMLLAYTARAVDGTLAKARQHGLTISLVGVACFWHSLIGLDATLRPLSPVYMWGDTRSRDEAARLRSTIDVETYRQTTGVTIHSSYWPAKLRWLRADDPERWDRARRWTSGADYLMHEWLGVDRTALPMASGTGLLDIQSGTWSERAITIAGIERASLPPIVGRDDAVAGLRPDWAARWPELANVPWYPPIGDGACANVGSGATGAARIALTLGTSGAVRGIIPAPIQMPFVVPKDLWAYRLDAEQLVVGAAVSNGGNVTAWVSNLTGAPINDAALGSFLTAEPDSHGLTVLPFLSGERSPLWSDTVTGVIAGLTQATDAERLRRAVMESVSLRLAMLYELLAPQMTTGHMVVANGGALLSSPAWQRITCDALGTALTILAPTDETAARGAAILALQDHGVLERIDDAFDPTAGRPVLMPDQTAHERYCLAGKRQQRLTSALEDAGFWN
jgi:gluconokinase